MPELLFASCASMYYLMATTFVVRVIVRSDYLCIDE